jgi:hypothetical protein
VWISPGKMGISDELSIKNRDFIEKNKGIF